MLNLISWNIQDAMLPFFVVKFQLIFFLSFSNLCYFSLINIFLQFSSAGVVRLPKFEMTLSKPEANQKPVLAAEDVHIVTV